MASSSAKILQYILIGICAVTLLMPAASAFASSATPRDAIYAPVTTLRMLNSTSAFAGGNGWIARTDDAGRTWKQQATIAQVQQIFALNPQLAWATSGTRAPYSLYSTTNGGSTWTRTGVVPNAAYLHFTEPQMAYAGGAMSTDGGSSWVHTPAPLNISGDVYFVNHTFGWAVNGTYQSVNFLHTQDGGQTWSIVYTRASQIFAELSGSVIRAPTSTDVWFLLLGGYGMSQQSYSLFHAVNNGQSWVAVLNDATAGGGPAPGWNSETGGFQNQGIQPGGFYVPSPSVAFVGGICGPCGDFGMNYLGRTVDGGQSWQNHKPQMAGSGSQLIAAVDANNVWMVVNDYQSPSTLYVSATGGALQISTFQFAQPPSQ